MVNCIRNPEHPLYTSWLYGGEVASEATHGCQGEMGQCQKSEVNHSQHFTNTNISENWSGIFRVEKSKKKKFCFQVSVMKAGMRIKSMFLKARSSSDSEH